MSTQDADPEEQSDQSGVHCKCWLVSSASIRGNSLWHILYGTWVVTAVIWCPDMKLLYGRKYSNDPKFSDRQALSNSVDPNQTATRGAD